MSSTSPVLLVTGASRGLGAAIARIAATYGASVVLMARSKSSLEKVAHDIKSSGGSALPLPGDITSESDCRRVIDATLNIYSHLDALINNSGQIEPIATLADSELNQWDQNLRVNLFGAVMLTHLAIPSLRQSHGRLIFISSGAAESVIPGWSAYSTAKAALNHLTRILAQEEPDITTLSVRPGVVDTEMQSVIRKEGKGRMGEKNYVRLYSLYETNNLLPPEKPAAAIAALALHAPHDLSGQVLSWDDPRAQSLLPR